VFSTQLAKDGLKEMQTQIGTVTVNNEELRAKKRQSANRARQIQTKMTQEDSLSKK
jgi:hypothetical protein